MRLPNDNIPLVWAQSLYYLALMLDEGLLEPGEIDPLGRRSWLDRNPGREDAYDADKPAAWNAFYESPPEVVDAFAVRALQFLTRGA